MLNRSPNRSLSTREHWDEVHEAATRQPKPGLFGRLLRFLFGDLPSNRYFEIEFWDRLVCAATAERKGGEILEIGVAPGLNVLRRAKKLGMTPWGLEFSPVGAALSRINFDAAGIDRQNVIQGDVLDEQLLAGLRNRFDIVYSAGLIEHFTAPSQIIDAHIELAALGGFVVITIPNLRGIYGPLLRLVNPDLLEIHNLELMKLDNFREALTLPTAELLFVEYFGFVDFDIIHAPISLRGRIIVAITSRVNAIVNLAAALCFRGRRLDSRFFSPYLVAVLHKKAMTR